MTSSSSLNKDNTDSKSTTSKAQSTSFKLQKGRLSTSSRPGTPSQNNTADANLSAQTLPSSTSTTATEEEASFINLIPPGMMHQYQFDIGLSFEGQVKHGQMHGKGSFTWPNGTAYAGHFHQQQITGQGAFSWYTRFYFTSMMYQTKQ